MPRATGTASRLSRYEEAWEATNRLIRQGGSWSGHERDCFYVQGAGGRFQNVSALFGVDAVEDGRGLAVLDFDRDGDPDLVLKNRTAPQLRLYRNDLARPGARVTVELRGTIANRFAIGARATLRAGAATRVKEVVAGSGFLSQSSPRLHFGLGDAARVDELTVRWPAGKVQSFRGLAVNRAYVVTEGEPEAQASEFIAASAPSPAPAPAPAPATAATAATAPATPTGVWLLDPCPLPGLRLEDARGAAVALDSFRGRVVLLHLWAPECPRCRGEFAAWSRERPATAAGGAGAAPAAGADPVLLAVTRGGDAGARKEAAAVAGASGLETLFTDDESLLALGLLLEDVVHWPREIAVPSSLLLDREGLAVKLYRGPVAWEAIARDAAAIPPSAAERHRRALPFPGQYHASELRRDTFQLGVSYLEAGLVEPAARVFTAALAWKERTADARYNLAIIEERRGDPAAAERLYAEALASEPDFLDARVNLGVLKAKRGALAEAAAEFTAVLAARPDHIEALMDLGNTELARGRPAEALRAFRRAGELDPGLGQARKKLGDALRRLGDVEGARREYLRAAELAPGDAETWSNLAVLQAQAGDLEAGLAAARQAIAADPRQAGAHSNAGLILQGLGRLDEAIASFERAIALDPSLDAPRLNLARAFLRAGKEDQAREALRQLLAVHPGHRGAQELLRKIEG